MENRIITNEEISEVINVLSKRVMAITTQYKDLSKSVIPFKISSAWDGQITMDRADEVICKGMMLKAYDDGVRLMIKYLTNELNRSEMDEDLFAMLRDALWERTRPNLVRIKEIQAIVELKALVEMVEQLSPVGRDHPLNVALRLIPESLYSY